MISGLRKSCIIFILILVIMMIALVNKSQVKALPQGVTITYNYTENATIRQGDSHTAAGGSFTTITLNVSSQTSKWKAYVGNVTGKMTLDNANNMTIYDWALTNVQGEVYTARSTITFSSLTCANRTNITSEDTTLNINSSSDDSINKTFTQQRHQSFVIGGTGTILNSTCYAIATYINDTTQAPAENATFQEVLLSDGTSLVFATILNDNKAGFDLSVYDFQMIVPDDPSSTSTPYYFYAELG